MVWGRETAPLGWDDHKVATACPTAGNTPATSWKQAMGPTTEPITPSESKVLEQLLLGSSNKTIAAALLLSRRTVESHMANLLAKTGCQSRTQLLLWALARR